MPIDRETEHCLPLKEARSLFASQPHYKTLLYWADAAEGYKGIVLETFKEGNALITSREAVSRFIAAINEEA